VQNRFRKGPKGMQSPGSQGEPFGSSGIKVLLYFLKSSFGSTFSKGGKNKIYNYDI